MSAHSLGTLGLRRARRVLRWQAAVPDHHQPRLDGPHAVAQHRATLLGVEHAATAPSLATAATHASNSGQFSNNSPTVSPGPTP
jgi:hypothetical protein